MAKPIESYLGQLRLKLESRFDSESADELLSEIRSHLVDAAAEFELEGVAPSEAERLSVARFGAPEKAAFLLPLGKQFGTGDRYWGRGAFWASTLAALGLTWYGLDPTARHLLTPSEIPPLLALVLCFYGYACWKARSFSMIRQSAVVIALILLATGIFQRHVVDPAFGGIESSEFSGLRVQRSPSQAGLAYWTGSGAAEMGMRLASGSEGSEGLAPAVREVRPAPSPEPEVAKSTRPIYGMAPIGTNPWELTRGGVLPEVSQLLLSWLFFILMANAAVCWMGCLEHEQKGGVLLVQ